MEENKDTSSEINRFQMDEMHKMNIVEWKKKRKLKSDQLDLHRPKHKCWFGRLSSEDASMFEENPVLESVRNHFVKVSTDVATLDERSDPESAKDSNSFIEDSDTAMSVNEEAKQEAECEKTYLYVKRVGYSEEDTVVESEYNPSYHDAEIQSLKYTEEQLLELGSVSGHAYSENAEDSNEPSVDKEFEEFLFSSGANPNMYVLSSGRWTENQEAKSSTRPPTIDQEFEEYFSMLML